MQEHSQHSKAFPLTMTQEGDIVRIARLRGGKNLETRLTSMGLNPGCELQVSQCQGNHLVVIRGETRLALGAGMSNKIMVERV